MILVQGGSFRMGSTQEELIAMSIACVRDPECDLVVRHGREVVESIDFDRYFVEEQPHFRTGIAAYWLDRTEVTVADYRRCADLGRCEPIAYHEGARRFARPDYPVSLVAWHQARQFCAFRNARLPYEAEYERAARGKNARRYPWGELYNTRASNHGRAIPRELEQDRRSVIRTDGRDGFVELAPVAALASDRTPDGFMDLAGNVSEWMWDPFRSYTEIIASGSVDPTRQKAAEPGAPRAVRGGNFETGSPWARGAARRMLDPRTREPTLGFRCARSALIDTRAEPSR
jgi:formylglycine-generating enzyme required for sulfatase activity